MSDLTELVENWSTMEMPGSNALKLSSNIRVLSNSLNQFAESYIINYKRFETSEFFKVGVKDMDRVLKMLKA